MIEENKPQESSAQDPWSRQARPATASNSSETEAPPERWIQAWAKEVLLEQRRARRGRFWGGLFRLLLLMAVALLIFASYNEHFSFSEKTTQRDVPHVAVIEIKGMLLSDGRSSADRVLAGAQRAFQAQQAQAVVLLINSPGGSPVQAGQIYQGLRSLREQHPDKPLYAVIEDLGASGGYYVAVAADYIIADPASLLGSIGVVSGGFAFKEALERLGIERRLFTAGENKAFLDPFSDIDSEQEVFWQGVLDSIHQQFIDRVQKGRGERLVQDPKIFSGLVWSGELALELGLIDELGSLLTLQNQLGVNRVVSYMPEPSPWERLERHLGSALATAFGQLLSSPLSSAEWQQP